MLEQLMPKNFVTFDVKDNTETSNQPTPYSEYEDLSIKKGKK
jgi:hypothetical protein